MHPLTTLLAGSIAEAVSDTLFHFLWEGAAIAAALAVAIHMVRPSSAATRYGLACAAMLAMVAAFGVTLAWGWPHGVTMTIQENTSRLRVPTPTPFTAFATAPSSAASRLNSIVAAWLPGAILLSLRSLMAWMAASRLKRSGVCAASEVWQAGLARLSHRIQLLPPLRLLESCLTDVPVVAGFLRPAILVPAALFTGFPADQLEFILIHELAHIRRCDYLVNLLQSIVEDLLFYHPAVWWVSSVMRAERENCCDDVVVAETHTARGLAAALAALEQNRWTAHEAALAANGGHLMNRVRRLLEGQDRPRLTPAPVFFASLLPVMLAIAASVPHAHSAGSQPLSQFPPPAAPVPRAPVLLAQAQPARAQSDPQQTQPPPATPMPTPTESSYKKWLNEEVTYIIREEERAAFSRLVNDAERERFVEQFWALRDPTQFRDEIYRRIAYADQNFGTANGGPGRETDRGTIYIKYGPPDERERNASGGGQTQAFPFEIWRYRFIERVGSEVTVEFTDTSLAGDYRMTKDPKAQVLDRFKQTPAQRIPNPFEDVAHDLPPDPPKPVVAPEDAIEEILFRGVRRIPADLLRNIIMAHPGDRFDQDALDRDTRALLNTQRFSDIRSTVERGQTGWVVTFTVVERPVRP
jgi:GWxTD domain-containing protein